MNGSARRGRTVSVHGSHTRADPHAPAPYWSRATRDIRAWLVVSFVVGALLGAACAPAPATVVPLPAVTPTAPSASGPTPLPTRTVFPPGQVFVYEAQQGDTLPAVAAHFNSTVWEVIAAM